MTKSRDQLMQEVKSIIYTETYTMMNLQNMTPSQWGSTIQLAMAEAIAKGIDHALHSMTHDQFEQTFGLKDQ